MSANARQSSGPVVTVAMVTYNSEDYVAEAIASVLAQDMGDFELLICDDHSGDGTWSTVQQFSDPRIRAIRNEKNLGEYANRNQAISLARGKYLIFIDGDDFIYPHGLRVMVRMLEEAPSAAVAIARPWSEQFIYPVELTPAEFFRCHFLGPDVLGLNFTHLLFKTSALRAIRGFDLRYRSGDSHVQFKLALKNNCLLVSDGHAWWRRTPGQASEALLRSHWLSAESTRYRLEILARSDCPLSAPERILARSNVRGVFLRIVLRYLARGRVIHAIRLLRASGISWDGLFDIFVRSSRPYLSEVTASNPIKLHLDSHSTGNVDAFRSNESIP